MMTTPTEPGAPLPRIDIGDPLYRFLTRRLHLRLFDVMSAMVIINVVRTIIIPSLYHAERGSIFLTEMNPTDVQLILISLITQPVVLYIYWRLVDFIPETFVSMIEKGVVRPRAGASAAEFLLRLEKQMTAPWLSWLALVIAIVTVITFQVIGWSTARTRGAFGSYPYNDFEQYVVESLYGLVRFWFLNWAVARLLLFVGALRTWWGQNDANVKPLHPDKAGGFSEVGNATLYGGLLLGGVGLFLITNILIELQRGSAVALAILFSLMAVIIVLSPYAFFSPIWATHKAMEHERLRQLNRLAGQYDALWSRINAGEDPPDKDHLTQLETLETMQSTVKRVVPVWPFALDDLTRFGIALAPIWTVAVTVIVQAIISSFITR